MSELKEFTAEEMKGVPSFKIMPKLRFDRATSDGLFVSKILEGLTIVISVDTIKCNPIDRMNALARGIFEQFEEFGRIDSIGNLSYIPFQLHCGDSIDLETDVFLHTERTSITREELGL